VTADADRVAALLDELIGIESVNPALDLASPGERQIAGRVADEFRRIGLEVTLEEALPGRPNVVGVLPGVGSSSTLLFEVHLDTVSVGRAGLIARREDGRIHGRGACDVKGALAALIHALEMLAGTDGPRARLEVVAAVDEEVGFRGIAHHLATHDVSADAAIVLEPTNLDVVVAHRGCVRLVFQTSGVAAHTSLPAQGRNAIDDMTSTLEALRGWNVRDTATPHPLCGGRLLTVSLIEGGTGVNTVPDRCTATLDIRTRPDDDPDAVIAEIEDVLLGLRSAGVRAEVTEVLLADSGLDTDPAAAVVEAALAAGRSSGVPCRIIGAPWGSDASKIARRAGIPTVVMGPGASEQAHTDDEWIAIDQLTRAADVFAAAARHLPERLGAAD
jgi:acetylornithine deacetylase